MFSDHFAIKNQEVKEQVVCVADFFVEDFRGGAELTTEAILKASPFSVYKFKPSTKKTVEEQKEFVRDNKNKTWIIGNFSSMHPQALEELVRQGTKYFVIEYDFKYCAFRSPQLHQIQTGQSCDCHMRPIGQWMKNFFLSARHVFYMSENQRKWYLERFPELGKNSSVQSSTWEPEHLDKLKQLSTSERSDHWAILTGASWIKGTEQTIEYAKSSKLKYDLLGDLPYQQFIEELSKRKGLIFLPLGFDTCPRIVIEAQLMGLDLILNENVLHVGEEWTKLSGEELLASLKERPLSFWNKLNSLL